MVQEVDFIKRQNNQISNHFNMLLEIEKIEKRNFRSLWITRINAASKELGVPYSKLVSGMSKNNIAINRKILSDIAISDEATFKKVVELASN